MASTCCAYYRHEPAGDSGAAPTFVCDGALLAVADGHLVRLSVLRSHNKQTGQVDAYIVLIHEQLHEHVCLHHTSKELSACHISQTEVYVLNPTS